MKCLRFGVLFFVATFLCLFLVSKANAATFVVDSTGDGGNMGGPGVCDDGTGDCTLRAAIEAANVTAGADTINFNIPGAGVHTITPTTNLPEIMEQLTIDGSTQPGASCGTLVPATLPGSNTPHTLLIEIDGTNTTVFPEGVIYTGQAAAANSLIKGLIINRMPSSTSAIWISNANGSTIECNYLGVNAVGTADLSVGRGVYADSIDGITVQNNLISGNNVAGFYFGVAGAGVFNITFQNNLVGTNAAGTSAIANGTGVSWQRGDVASFTHNVISGNTNIGLNLGEDYSSTANNYTVSGNYIGLSVTGGMLGNGGDGLRINKGYNFTIGGTTTTQRNVISANGGSGINVIHSGASDCSPSELVEIYNNFVGVDVNGNKTVGYGNDGSGIEVNEIDQSCGGGSVYKYLIGGDSAGQPNTIAGNAQDGVRISQYIDPGDPATHTDVFSIAVLPNTIYGNGNLGINLATDSDNDGIADLDLGPNPLNNLTMAFPSTHANYYINHPQITASKFEGNQLTIQYSYQAPPVSDNLPSISQADIVGYRLDFYLNDAGQDGGYPGYNQGKTHLGSFIVNGSTTNATHTFTSPIQLTNSMNINSTATVLWTVTPNGGRTGTGPPYQP